VLPKGRTSARFVACCAYRVPPRMDTGPASGPSTPIPRTACHRCPVASGWYPRFVARERRSRPRANASSPGRFRVFHGSFQPIKRTVSSAKEQKYSLWRRHGFFGCRESGRPTSRILLQEVRALKSGRPHRELLRLESGSTTWQARRPQDRLGLECQSRAPGPIILPLPADDVFHHPGPTIRKGRRISFTVGSVS